MEVQAKLSDYFKSYSVRPCPMRKAFRGLRFAPKLSSRRSLLSFSVILFLILAYFSSDRIYGRNDDPTQGLRNEQDGYHQQQPCDGGTGGHSNKKTGSHDSNKSDPGGGSSGTSQAPPLGGSGSSSSGDDGGDDPNKRRPSNKKQPEASQVEGEEEENKDDETSEQSTHKDAMVAGSLQPGTKPLQRTDTSRVQGGSSVHQELNSYSVESSGYSTVKTFGQSEQLRMCPLQEMVFVHDVTSDEEQPQALPQSAASAGEELLSLEVSTAASILDEVPIYATIDIQSFSGPQSSPYLDLDVSSQAILSHHADTYYELAQLPVVQEQVLDATQATEPFNYTLAMLMYDQGTPLLIPCGRDQVFDPTDDLHIVAVPVDLVLSNFSVRVNPQLLRLQ